MASAKTQHAVALVLWRWEERSQQIYVGLKKSTQHQHEPLWTGHYHIPHANIDSAHHDCKPIALNLSVVHERAAHLLQACIPEISPDYLQHAPAHTMVHHKHMLGWLPYPVHVHHVAIRLPKHISMACREMHELNTEQLLWQHRRGDLLLSIPTYQALVWLMEHGGRSTTEHSTTEIRQYYPGLSILPLPAPALPPITHVNCYILGKRYLTLVDPGCREQDTDDSGTLGRSLLQKAVEQRIREGAIVKDIWITHHHPDHHAAAAWLREIYGARLWAHPQVAEMLPELRIDGLLNEGVPYWVDPRTTETTVWYPMLTPGHAPGHLCFYQPDRGALLTGDMLLGHGNTFVPPRPLGSLRDYCRALERLDHLNAKHFLCGHGPPLSGEDQPIAQQLYHRQRRQQQIRQCLHQPSRFAEIFQRIYGHIEPSRSQLAQNALLAYLEALEEDGIIARGQNGLYFSVR